MILCVILTLSLLAGCDTGDSVYVPTGNGLAGDSTEKPITVTPPDNEQQIALLYNPSAALNPYQCMDYTNRMLFSLLYQGLFTVDRTYQVKPMLCQSYNVSADMKTYTFYIESALFSDGTALTPDDVVASLKAAKKSSWYSGRLQHVDSISSYGEAVVVELDTAMEDLPILLDIPIVKASQVDDDAPLGSGPYRLDGDQLRRQAGWWCSANLTISCDTIALVEGGTAAEVRDRFEFQQVSLVCTDPSDVDYVDFHSDYELWESENGLFVYLACNEESEIFSDDDVRAALTHAIDRDSLIERFYLGFARSAQLPVSPQSPYYNTTLASNYGYAPEVLRNALQKADLAGSEVVLLLNGDDATRVKVGNAIADMLEECGLKVTIQESSTKNFTKDLKKGKYDLYLAQTRLSVNMDLSAFFGTDTALNYGGLADPGLYTISLEALANRGNYYTLCEMVMDDGQLCPILFQSYAIYSQRGAFAQLDPIRDNLFYYDLGRTMDDALMSETQ